MVKLDPFISARSSLRRHETSRPQARELERYCARTEELSAALDAAEPATVRGVAAVVESAATFAEEVPALAKNLRAASARIGREGLTPSTIAQLRSWHWLAAAFANGEEQWDGAACIVAMAKALAAAERLEGAVPTPGRSRACTARRSPRLAA